MRFLLQSHFRYFMILFLIIGTLLPNPATPSAQASSGYAYKWTLDFDYNNSFDGLLKVQVGKNDGSGGVVQPPIHTQNFTVACHRVGAVSLVAGIAKFDGGYLECDFDLAQALDRTFEKCHEIESGCRMPINTIEEYTSYIMGADLNTPVIGVAPILTHDSTAFAVNVGSSTHTVQTTLDPIGSTDSSPWNVIPPINAAYRHNAAFGCSLAGDCGIQFNVAGNAEYVDTADDPVGFSTPHTTIYIGRDAGGTVIAAGSMLDNVYVDPGNGLPD